MMLLDSQFIFAIRKSKKLDVLRKPLFRNNGDLAVWQRVFVFAVQNVRAQLNKRYAELPENYGTVNVEPVVVFGNAHVQRNFADKVIFGGAGWLRIGLLHYKTLSFKFLRVLVQPAKRQRFIQHGLTVLYFQFAVGEEFYKFLF